MSLILYKEFVFDAAHQLPNHPGLCKNLHGHTYKLTVGVSAHTLNDQGMVIDFSNLKQTVQQCVLAPMDHHFINDLLPNPTAELMVEWIVDTLRLNLPSAIQLESARLYETPTSYVEWRREVTCG